MFIIITYHLGKCRLCENVGVISAHDWCKNGYQKIASFGICLVIFFFLLQRFYLMRV